ncbi:MAG: hypothetical protein IMW99_03740 [Firmicutes bacterium]|nr:hypothetical protein [Bacillota bacterium]
MMLAMIQRVAGPRKAFQGVVMSGLWLILLLALLALPAAAGSWSGSQTVTWEGGPDPGTDYTAALEYSLLAHWVATLVLDVDHRYGPALDISTTLYTPGLKEIYVTAGIRFPGREALSRQPVPYVSATYRF